MLKVNAKATFSFKKLLRYIESGQLDRDVNKILGSHIAFASKRFIMQGKVTPKLKNETIKRRRRLGINTNTPLFRTGDLANSLKATKEGIKGVGYGEYHLKGDGVQKRNFAAIEKEKIKKPLNTLMKKLGKAFKR